MENRYFPKPDNPITSRIPNNIPYDTKQVFTPKSHPDVCTAPLPNDDVDWYDEPDYTQAVAQGIQEVLAETPRLTRSEAEEQMHLTELRRQAEGYNENDARVIADVLSKRYPIIMFDALLVEFTDMKHRLDTITGAVNNETN